MTAPKTLGQIAYEAHETARGVTTFPWGALHALEHEFWEDIGAAVAAAHQQRVAAWLLSQPDMCTTDSQAALWQAAQMLIHGEIV